MLARISTTFDCTAEQLWDEISRPASLRFVAAPLLHFEPLVPGELDSDWVVGKTYALRLFMFGFLPAGEHRITLASIDREANLIESKENDFLQSIMVISLLVILTSLPLAVYTAYAHDAAEDQP